jgi:hypothetical protein
MQYLDIIAVGGIAFDVHLLTEYAAHAPGQQVGKSLGRIEFGSLSPDGQFEQDDDEVIDFVREHFDISSACPAGVR